MSLAVCASDGSCPHTLMFPVLSFFIPFFLLTLLCFFFWFQSHYLPFHCLFNGKFYLGQLIQLIAKESIQYSISSHSELSP